MSLDTFSLQKNFYLYFKMRLGVVVVAVVGLTVVVVALTVVAVVGLTFFWYRYHN